MEKMNLATEDVAAANLARLLELFPGVVTETLDADGEETLAVDADALRLLIGAPVVEGSEERYRFTWPGKSASAEKAYTPVSKTLRPVLDRSEGWYETQNLYIEGDNFDALKLLRAAYAGKVRAIYIDPPYNTGNEFLYEDDFSESDEEYRASSDEFDFDGRRLQANTAADGRRHSRWCSNMYERLLVAKDLLSEDGAIFISIDDNELHNLRKICESPELFGSECFVADISWQRTYSPRNDSLGIPVEVEHILVYSRKAGWSPKRLARTEEMNSRYSSDDGDAVPWKAGDASAPGASTHHGMVYAIQQPITGALLYPSNGRHWTYGQSQMLEYLSSWAEYEVRKLDDDERRAEICGCSTDEVKDGTCALVLKDNVASASSRAQERYEQGSWPRLYFTSKGKGGLACKRYLDEVEGMLPTNLWMYEAVGHSDEAKKVLKKLFDDKAPFDTPKPVRLMRRILDIATDPDSIVLDFFSGSASMAQAVMEKNADDGGSRKFVLVQLPEPVSGDFSNLCEVGEERIRRAAKKIRQEIDDANRQLELGADPKEVPDLGFRVLAVDSSNFMDVEAPAASFNQAALDLAIDNVKPGRTDLDLLFQVLPKFRIPYSAPYREVDVAGRKAFAVNGRQLVACFADSVDNAAIEAIARMRPVYVVFKDSTLDSDSTAANLEELFKTFSPDTTLRVI